MFTKRSLALVLVFWVTVIPAYSCTPDDFYFFAPYNDLSSSDNLTVNQFAPLSFTHQSAAVYSDYVFFVTNGRSNVGLYSLIKKEMLFTLDLKGVDGKTYHCNQSSFGIEKYEPTDFFPLLYF